MKVITAGTRAGTLLKMYEAVLSYGVMQIVRGQKVINVCNMAVELEMSHGAVVTSFEARKFNLPYAKREWLWYLGGDKYDTSIEQYATMWKKLKQPDGSFYSNYGQYIFNERLDQPPEPVGSQFNYVVQTLKDDECSRRASIVLLKSSHLYPTNSDVVCTYAINFCIEYGELHMTVMMRSNDVIFGFTNDAFCFGELYEFVYQRLRDESYPNLYRGIYTHFTNSMHVYERHFDMIRQIIGEGLDAYAPILCVRPSPDEVRELVKSKGKESSGDYLKWLTTET